VSVQSVLEERTGKISARIMEKLRPHKEILMKLVNSQTNKENMKKLEVP